MRNKQLFNRDWYFKIGFDKNDINGINLSTMERIDLPHSVKTLPYNCFSHNETAINSTYYKEFIVSKDDLAKRTVIEFEGIMAYYDLYVNGNLVGSFKGGYSISSFEITPFLKEGKNAIVMNVDSHERSDIPPFGFVIDYLTFGGIYRDVNLYTLEDTYIANMFVRYELDNDKIVIHPELFIDSTQACNGEIVYEICDFNQFLYSFNQAISIEKGTSAIQLNPEAVSELKRWNPEEPNLYQVTARIIVKGEEKDSTTTRVGFRTVEAKPNGLFINGKKQRLIGINRHQSYPYTGYAMPKRAQQSDVDLLKEYGFNAIRTSHYMQSKYFLDRCDELGILIFEEIPGWQFIGDDEFKKNTIANVNKMIEHDFNHPSIFMWGVRVNESLDDDELYKKTNALARSMDPSRPTSGVRYLHGSSFLEDVYAYNDFSHADEPGLDYVQYAQREVTQRADLVPFVVTEYMGHTYPVKQFDNEKRLDEHVRRHAQILARTMTRKDSLGSFGWCAFDYNTHGDFGAGDKICYHGIFDMFRIPKYAAWMYRSQKDPKDEVILQPITNFARGEKDLDGINPFLVATNCDYIEVYMYGKNVARCFPSDKFIGLKHPLIEVTFDDKKFWNLPWQDGSIIGYINNKKVAEYKYARDSYLSKIGITQETGTISCQEVDTCRFECDFLDQLNHPCLFYNGVLQFETEGDIEVIGPKYVAAVGGRIAFWVKSIPTGKPSTAKVKISAPATDFKPQIFTIELV